MKITKVIQLILLLLFTILSHRSIAQNSVIIYSNFHYLHYDRTPRHYNGSDYTGLFTFDNVSFAFRREKGNVGHEFELKLYFNKEERENHKVEQFLIQLGYEYGWGLKHKLFKVLDMRFGFAFRLYNLREEIDSEDYLFTTFPTERTVTGIWIGFFTHLEYNLSPRFYLNANTSIATVKAEQEHLKIDDPNLSEDLREGNLYELGTIYEPILRLGVGYRFGGFKKEGE